MLEGFLFKTKNKGVNHITTGIDDCKSLCGAVSYNSKSSNPYMKKIGEKMGLDELLLRFSKYCSRCVSAAEKQIESDEAYLVDAPATKIKEENKKKNILF